MAEELQSLLDKINEQGIVKAEAEKAKIIAAAEKQAADIVSEAEKKAEKIIADAEKDAAASAARANDAMQQAARDILLQLRGELTDRLRDAVNGAGAKAMSAEFMAQLIKELAAAFAVSPDSEICVRTALKDAAALDAALEAALAESLSAKPQVLAAKGITSGMEVSFDGGACFYDFTLDAVSGLMEDYIGGKIGNIFRDAK